MPFTTPSIQSFYKPEVRVHTTTTTFAPPPTTPGDGFTEEELADTLDPSHRKWNPEREYEECGIGELVPGPKAVRFCGRVVAVRTLMGGCGGGKGMRMKARGFQGLVLRDDGGAVSIKLYFAHNPYPLKLGQLLSIWTAFISDTSKTETPQIPSVTVHANLFPGRVTSDHVLIHTTPSSDAICRTPLGYKKGQPLSGLMTVKSYLDTGHDGVTGAKLLVCVKSIGGKKKISRRNGGGECELADVVLFDHTSEVRLTVWNELIESVKSWKAGETVLLISNPGFRVRANRKGELGITACTMVDVEPEGLDAEWLRRFATGLTRKESLCLKVPEGVWDIEAYEYGVTRMLFTLAELDNWVRSDGNQVFSCFLSVTILEMQLVTIHRRNMLMCAECCGTTLFSNTPKTPCPNCTTPLPCTLNPRILGPLIDETGCLTPSQLVWSPRAWEKLFGRSIGEICNMRGEEIRLFEQRVVGLRCHLVVGWDGGRLGRLCVLGVFA